MHIKLKSRSILSQTVTEYCHDVVLRDDLEGPSGDEVQGGEDVPGVDQRVPGRRVCCLELQRQRAKAPCNGRDKGFTVYAQV